LPGCRIKHRMKRNWLKMYDKAGWILRVETVINDPEEFRVRRRVRRRGRRRTEWVPLRKSVAYLFRYRDVSLQSNAQYLNALAQVEDPTAGLRGLDTITTRKRSTKALNPVARPDCQLFTALMSGEYAVHGFANRDLRSKLAATVVRLNDDPRRQSAQVSRLLHRLHVYGLVAKIPRSRRWRVTAFGQRIMSTSVKLRQWQFPANWPSCMTPSKLVRKNRRPNEGRSYAPFSGGPSTSPLRLMTPAIACATNSKLL